MTSKTPGYQKIAGIFFRPLSRFFLISTPSPPLFSPCKQEEERLSMIGVHLKSRYPSQKISCEEQKGCRDRKEKGSHWYSFKTEWGRL